MTMLKLPPSVAEWERLMTLRPLHISEAVWKGGIAIAMVHHPKDPYPLPQDTADALTVLAAAAPGAL